VLDPINRWGALSEPNSGALPALIAPTNGPDAGTAAGELSGEVTDKGGSALVLTAPLSFTSIVMRVISPP